MAMFSDITAMQNGPVVSDSITVPSALPVGEDT